jgi:Leucine-rich repeat (LRR) protein
LWHKQSGIPGNPNAKANSDTANGHKIMFIRIVDTELDSRQILDLPQQLSIHRDTEVLVLRNIGLSTLDGINLPNLRYLDVSHNNLSNAESCFNMLLPAFYDRVCLLHLCTSHMSM